MSIWVNDDNAGKIRSILFRAEHELRDAFHPETADALREVYRFFETDAMRRWREEHAARWEAIKAAKAAEAESAAGDSGAILEV